MANEKTEIEKLNLNSMSIVEEKQNELLRLFPEIRTEGGKIDFEKLKLTLGQVVDTGKERYGMNWPGKIDCYKIIQTPSLGTLVPEKEQGIDFDKSSNLFIEGDSLEVLKLLQKPYLNSIKIIYIDPPYNTGNDFIYPDDFSESLETYLKYTGQITLEGKKFSTNVETDGRFHSKWLNMMFTRLFLARNLLRDDGVIFVSVDEHEVTNLRKLCDEIFGEENFIETIIWKNKFGAGAATRGFISTHEYILCYSKTPISNIQGPLSEEEVKKHNRKDSKYDVRGPYRIQPLQTKSMADRPNLVYPINWKGNEIWPNKQWVWSKDRMEAAIANDDVEILETKDGFSVNSKQYLKDENGQPRQGKPTSVFNGPFTQEGTTEIRDIFGKDVFPFPKPSTLIKQLLNLTINEDTDTDYYVLDFFAGSCSTAHAVLQLNSEDNGDRKFICVQLPEECDEKSEAKKAGYKTISEIGKDRIRKVIEKYNTSKGFRVFKLAESNFKAWDNSQTSKQELENQLELHVDHVKHDRTAEDILFEILLKSGFPLATKVETQKFGNSTVYSVAGGMLLVCLEDNLTLDLIKHIAEQKPERVVCLDQGFANNDQLKANAVQIFRTKGISSFKTV